MESRIRIKMGSIEVEYEGSQQFIKNELLDLIRNVSDMCTSLNISNEQKDDGGDGGQVIQMSTGSIATKLSCNSGADLAIAAAAHLTFVKNTKVFSRKALLKEMQTAASYYKSSYSNNLTKILNLLLKKEFNEPSTGNYALAAPKKEELRSKLA